MYGYNESLAQFLSYLSINESTSALFLCCLFLIFNLSTGLLSSSVYLTGEFLFLLIKPNRLELLFLGLHFSKALERVHLLIRFLLFALCVECFMEISLVKMLMLVLETHFVLSYTGFLIDELKCVFLGHNNLIIHFWNWEVCSLILPLLSSDRFLLIHLDCSLLFVFKCVLGDLFGVVHIFLIYSDENISLMNGHLNVYI